VEGMMDEDSRDGYSAQAIKLGDAPCPF